MGLILADHQLKFHSIYFSYTVYCNCYYSCLCSVVVMYDVMLLILVLIITVE